MHSPLDLRDACYIAGVLVISSIVGMASEQSPYPLRTDLMYALEGNAVAVLQPDPNLILTTVFVIVYLLVYPTLLLATYVSLKYRHGRNRALDYVTTYTTVLIVSMPFFYFVPVGVTGYYLQGVEPVLYESTGPIQTFMKNVDTLQKAFPSLHAGLAGTAALYAPSGYKRLSWAITGTILAATIYLGIHWLTDLVVGLALAYGCYLATPTIRAHLERGGPQPEPVTVTDD
ncbi:phosphatase PAP2 family protein [Natrinema sp. DC36]|uniref:phosphatase PAP2 family protein n=1 Tax=Natrinema sp. DC36 TaxID=2878680 RepID=UPI001CF0790B|nr:phosphatase PAP2 family protein [Natrinema sp. DC36]